MSSAAEQNDSDVFAILGDHNFNKMRLCITTDINLYPYSLHVTDNPSKQTSGNRETNVELGPDFGRSEAHGSHN